MLYSGNDSVIRKPYVFIFLFWWGWGEMRIFARVSYETHVKLRSMIGMRKKIK